MRACNVTYWSKIHTISSIRFLFWMEVVGAICRLVPALGAFRGCGASCRASRQATPLQAQLHSIVAFLHQSRADNTHQPVHECAVHDAEASGVEVDMTRRLPWRRGDAPVKAEAPRSPSMLPRLDGQVKSEDKASTSPSSSNKKKPVRSAIRT